MKCKICNNDSAEIFSTKVLGKYNVKYYKCTNCSFIQTEQAYWLNESYSSAITKLDIGLIQRNIELSKKTTFLINFYFNTKNKFLDFAGGYGLFVRLMRDNGFEFYRQDRYCQNIFAESFDIKDIKHQNFELVTSFEVFEHLENPMSDIDEMLTFSQSILFSTLLQPNDNVNPQNWWYISPEIGQHISLYHLNSIKHIAKLKNLNLYTNGKSLHLLTSKRINNYFFRLITNNKISNLLYYLLGPLHKSLSNDDYYYLKNKLK